MLGILPESAEPTAALLLLSRGLRAFGDGLFSLLLPVYLASLGLSAFEIGVLVTATLAGSSILTLSIGLLAHRFSGRGLLIAAALLMTLTGVAFTVVQDFWPLLLVAFVGTMNPSAGDVSLFLPLEQAQLSRTVADRDRTALFARYSLVGSLAGAVGALAAGVPEWLGSGGGVGLQTLIQGAFVLYALLGLASLLLYRRLPAEVEFNSAYSASKFGLEGWMEALSAEVAPFGIETMIVNPGFFRTELITEESTSYAEPSVADYHERRAAQIAFYRSQNGKQGGDPVKLARALVTLADQDELPRRFLAGTDAIGVAEQKIALLQQQIEAHRELSSSLAID